MSTKFEYDLAISYSTEDSLIVDAITKQLRKSDIRYYDYSENETTASDIEEQTKRVYEFESAYALLIFSKNYLKSKWTRREWDIIQSVFNKSDRQYLIILRVDDSTPENEELNSIIQTLSYHEWKGEPASLVLSIVNLVNNSNNQFSSHQVQNSNGLVNITDTRLENGYLDLSKDYLHKTLSSGAELVQINIKLNRSSYLGLNRLPYFVVTINQGELLKELKVSEDIISQVFESSRKRIWLDDWTLFKEKLQGSEDSPETQIGVTIDLNMYDGPIDSMLNEITIFYQNQSNNHSCIVNIIGEGALNQAKKLYKKLESIHLRLNDRRCGLLPLPELLLPPEAYWKQGIQREIQIEDLTTKEVIEFVKSVPDSQRFSSVTPDKLTGLLGNHLIGRDERYTISTVYHILYCLYSKGKLYFLDNLISKLFEQLEELTTLISDILNKQDIPSYIARGLLRALSKLGLQQDIKLIGPIKSISLQMQLQNKAYLDMNIDEELKILGCKDLIPVCKKLNQKEEITDKDLQRLGVKSLIYLIEIGSKSDINISLEDLLQSCHCLQLKTETDLMLYLLMLTYGPSELSKVLLKMPKHVRSFFGVEDEENEHMVNFRNKVLSEGYGEIERELIGII